MMQTHSYDTLVLVMGEIRGWLSISCCKQKLIFLSIFLGQKMAIFFHGVPFFEPLGAQIVIKIGTHLQMINIYKLM